MRANLGKIYDTTITVINRLDARDSKQKMDEFKATVVKHCMWSLVTSRTVQLDGTVTIGTSHRVQIPESAFYVPYNEWKSSQAGFTIRPGDYIIKGVVYDDVTAENYKSVIKRYEPDAFEVQTFRDATKGDGFEHSTYGAKRFVEPYIIEG